MKKLIALFALCLSLHSQAGVIKIETDKSSYTVNDTVTAQIKVSGLAQNQSLAAYLFKLALPQSGLQFLSYQFGAALAGPLDSLQDLFTDNGALNVSEISFAADTELAQLQQAGEFTLLSLTFKVLQAGLFALDLSDVDFADASNQSIAVSGVTGSSFAAVTAPAVPAPATLLLLFPALLLMARRR